MEQSDWDEKGYDRGRENVRCPECGAPLEGGTAHPKHHVADAGDAIAYALGNIQLCFQFLKTGEEKHE